MARAYAYATRCGYSERSAVDTGVERASRSTFFSGAAQRVCCEVRSQTAKSGKLRSFECRRTAPIRSLEASGQNLIVPPRDKARFRASNETESSCSALIPPLRAPKRSDVTTGYGCHGRSARHTSFLSLSTLSRAPPTSTSALLSQVNSNLGIHQPVRDRVNSDSFSVW